MNNGIEIITDRHAFEEMFRRDEERLNGLPPVYATEDHEHVEIRQTHPDGSATTTTGRTLSPAEVQALTELTHRPA